MVYLYLTKGTTETFNVQILDGSTPYELQPGEKIVFTVKDKLDGQVVIQKEITEASEDDTYTFTINDEDTSLIPIDRSGAHILWYNLVLYTPNGTYEAIATSPLVIKNNVRGVVE